WGHLGCLRTSVVEVRLGIKAPLSGDGVCQVRVRSTREVAAIGLLLGCAIVARWLLARAAPRQKEIAVRLENASALHFLASPQVMRRGVSDQSERLCGRSGSASDLASGTSCSASSTPALCNDALGGHLAHRWGALLRLPRLPCLGHQARLFVHL